MLSFHIQFQRLTHWQIATIGEASLRKNSAVTICRNVKQFGEFEHIERTSSTSRCERAFRNVKSSLFVRVTRAAKLQDGYKEGKKDGLQLPAGAKCDREAERAQNRCHHCTYTARRERKRAKESALATTVPFARIVYDSTIP